MEGEYTVNLSFTVEPEILGKNYKFEVKNSLGTTTYQFELPPIEPTDPVTDPTTVSTPVSTPVSILIPTLIPTTVPTPIPTTVSTTVPTMVPTTDPELEPKGYEPVIVNVTYYGFQKKENSLIEVIFRASPMPDSGYWYIGNTQILFGTTEAQYLGASNVDEKFISSQIKKTEENLSDTYLVQLNFTMVLELEEKWCSLVVENSFGATNETFQMPKIKLEPTPEPPIEPPTEPPNGPISRPVTRPVTGPVTGPPVGPPTELKIKFKPEIVNVNHTG